MCLGVLSASVTVHHKNVVVWCPWTRLSDRHELPYESRKSNLGSLEEQRVLLRADSFFQAPKF